MELRQLETFLVLARTLNFTKAAAELYMVQSGLSQQIARLENDLGVQLFDRTSRRVVLTEAGELFRPRAEMLVRLAQEAQDDMAELAGVARGTLRLGVSQGIDGAFDVPRLLGDFSARHPGIRLLVRDKRSAQMIADLEAGELDAAFMGRDPEALPAGTAGVRLATETLVVVAGPDHPLAGRDVVSLKELAEAGPMAQSAEETRLRALVDEAWETAGVRPTVNLEVAELAQLVRYAARGRGAALVPAGSLRHAAPPPGQPPSPTMQLRETVTYPVTCAYRSPGPSSPAARRLLAVLAENFGLAPATRERLVLAATHHDPRRSSAQARSARHVSHR